MLQKVTGKAPHCHLSTWSSHLVRGLWFIRFGRTRWRRRRWCCASEHLGRPETGPFRLVLIFRQFCKSCLPNFHVNNLSTIKAFDDLMNVSLIQAENMVKSYRKGRSCTILEASMTRSRLRQNVWKFKIKYFLPNKVQISYNVSWQYKATFKHLLIGGCLFEIDDIRLLITRVCHLEEARSHSTKSKEQSRGSFRET